jgi:hypothetical protein
MLDPLEETSHAPVSACLAILSLFIGFLTDPPDNRTRADLL